MLIITIIREKSVKQQNETAAEKQKGKKEH